MSDEALTDEQLEEIKQKNPGKKLQLLTAPSGEQVVVRKPTEQEWARFQAKAQDDSQRMGAVQVLLTACLVYPDRAAFKDMIEESPGLTQTFALGVFQFAGAGQAEKKVL